MTLDPAAPPAAGASARGHAAPLDPAAPPAGGASARGHAAPLAVWRLSKPLRERIVAGHPWIYDRALVPPRLPATVAAGDLVTVADADGPIVVAFVDPTSPIRARVLDVPGTVIDARWVSARVEAAARRRARDPLLVGCTGVRLVHGEGDRTPGLVIDQYADTAVIVLDGPGASAFWRPRLPAVLDGLGRGGVDLAHVWLRGDRGSRAQGEALQGNPPASIAIHEDEARFGVDVRAGQKTGFFLDQRDNRRTIRRHAAGASVLNVFSYTGGFSLHAALGGASSVTSVDLAAPAIASLRANLALSGLPAEGHEAVAIDAFEFFTRAAARGRVWDLVIVDPPSFAPSERAKGAALGAYRKLAAAALRVTTPGGRFAFASCSSHITEGELLEIVAGAALEIPTAPFVALRAAAGAASDHPVIPAFPEGRYLKFLLFDVT